MDPENAAIPDGTEGSAPPEGATDATPSLSAQAVREELQARLTEMGRERKAALDKAAELEARLGYTGQVVANQSQELQFIRQQMSKQKWDDFEARLAQMNPVDAANERTRVAMEYTKDLERRLMQAQQRPAPQQQPRRESDDDYSRRRGQEMLASANRRHKLAGAAALTLEEMPSSAWADEETFLLEANAMAAKKAAAREDNDLSNPKTAAKLREEIKKDLIKELGAGRSMSPSAAPGYEEPANEDVARIAQQHTFRSGPQKSLDALRKNRESILAKMNQ